MTKETLVINMDKISPTDHHELDELINSLIRDGAVIFIETKVCKCEDVCDCAE